MESIHEASDPVDAVRKAEGIFIGECVLPAPPPPLYSVGSYGCCVCVCVCRRRRKHVPAAEESL